MAKKKNKKLLLQKAIRRRKIVLGIFAAISLVVLILFSVLLISYCSKADDSAYVYAAFFKDRMIRHGIYCMIIFCVVWVGIFVCIKFSSGFEFFKTWMILLFALLVCGLFIYGFVHLRNQYLDLSREDHVVFQGEFEKTRDRDFVFLDDGTRLWNVREKTSLQEGEYTGTVVYSKRTKYILDIEID